MMKGNIVRIKQRQCRNRPYKQNRTSMINALSLFSDSPDGDGWRSNINEFRFCFLRKLLHSMCLWKTPGHI